MGGLIVAEQVLLFRGVRPMIQKLYSRQSWWDYLTTYRRLFCQDVQKEIQYTSILAIHHLFGGALMLKGLLSQSPEWFAAGMLVELADDVHDSALMLLKGWPFGDAGAKMDVKLTTIMLAHHLAGILTIVPCLTNGLHTNVHVQKLGTALLSAGGISLVVLSASRTCDRRVASEARQCAALWVGNWFFYFYCRFYIYPQCILGLYREEFGQMSQVMQRAFIGFSITMTAFNVAILADGTQITISRLTEAWKLTVGKSECKNTTSRTTPKAD